ncbi:cutinase family protein [Mycolicibacterium sp. P1-18]|uniref:cutinase family protein n=1 Tax=Mycolicibacterium sp. P1-18 TaxID=2024615 RepID=UPI0011F20382|nr:cutinase family protein [Mycolicibacterium sp. P1-18]KAA0099534.1 cutinase family protein [Mycolicibacterium sp. P1-18]
MPVTAVVLAVVGAVGTSTASPATATADGCSDVLVIFARGTFEAPGAGKVGDPFIAAVRARAGERTVDEHAVIYPASIDFPRVVDGVVDASTTIRAVAQSCPDTKMVVGGYSQGAAVAAYTTFDHLPPDVVLPPGITGPLPPEVASHVSSVVLFGLPTNRVVSLLDSQAPPIEVGDLFAGKILELCNPGDPVCEPGGRDRPAHSAYVDDGSVDRAADFAAAKLGW